MVKKLKYAFLMLSVLSVIGLSSFQPVSAQSDDPFGIQQAKVGGLGDGDLRTIINGVITTVMSFLGIVAVVVILFGGFKWMTSGGDQTKVDTARKLIINGVIGLVIIILAWAITAFVIDEILKATTASN